MASHEHDLRGAKEVTTRRAGTVYEVADWRPGIDPPGRRWGATCEKGEVFWAHTKDEACAQLADHECSSERPSWFNQASTDGDWAATELAQLPGGRPTPAPHGSDEKMEYFDCAEFDRQGRLFRSALKHWSPSLRVSGTFRQAAFRSASTHTMSAACHNFLT